FHDIEAIIDRIVVKPGLRDRLDESVALTLKVGDGACIVSQQVDSGWQDHLYSSRFVCPQCGTSYPEIEPRSFSFNSPYGACPQCQGLGVVSVDGVVQTCAECEGTRLQPIGRRVVFQGLTLPDFTNLTVADAQTRLAAWRISMTSDTTLAAPTRL